MGTFELLGLVVVVSILVAVAFDTVERWLVNRRSSIGDDAIAREEVAVGDVWEHVGDYRPGLVYVVAGPNSNTEAGPDSWVRRVASGDVVRGVDEHEITHSSAS